MSDESNSAETANMSHSDSAGTYLGAGGSKRNVEETDGLTGHTDGVGSHADMLTMQTDVSSVETNPTKPANETGNVRMRRINSRTRNSPETPEIATAKPTSRWRRVGIGNASVHVPRNAPTEVLSRTFAFGQPESGDKAIAPSLEGERIGDGDGRRREGDGDESGDRDGMASSGNVNSM